MVSFKKKRRFIIEPHHDKTCFCHMRTTKAQISLRLPYANNKGADQPAHPRSLISAFVVRCLDSIIHLVSISEISSIYLASLAAQAGLCLTWSQTPKTGFIVTRLNCNRHQKIKKKKFSRDYRNEDEGA